MRAVSEPPYPKDIGVARARSRPQLDRHVAVDEVSLLIGEPVSLSDNVDNIQVEADLTSGATCPTT